MKTMEEIKKYAVDCHKNTNHLYGDRPYEVHLAIVVTFAKYYLYLVDKIYQDSVVAACWCHDLIEDTRETYNDVRKQTNTLVADIVYAVTNEKGKTRKERANDKYYFGIRNTPWASFVKVCDRLANSTYSQTSGSSMFEKYKKEYPEFKEQLYSEELKDMFAELEKIYNE